MLLALDACALQWKRLRYSRFILTTEDRTCQMNAQPLIWSSSFSCVSFFCSLAAIVGLVEADLLVLFGRWALWEATASDPHAEMHYLWAQTGRKNKQGDDGCLDLPAELKYWREKKCSSKHFAQSKSRYLILLQINCVFCSIYLPPPKVSYS